MPMARKRAPRKSTIENRVYVFTELAAAFLREHGVQLASADAAERDRTRRALAEIAQIACVFSDTEDLTAFEVRDRIIADR